MRRKVEESERMLLSVLLGYREDKFRLRIGLFNVEFIFILFNGFVR